MKEIEIKILDIDKDEVIKKIESLGAKKTFEGEVISTYFNNGKFKEEGKVLRVRRKNDEVILTYKEKSYETNAKIRDEYETKVQDYETIRRILIGLGYAEKLTLKKHRISYGLKDVFFEIDKLPGIPVFLEIEAVTEELVDKYVNILGFSKNDVKPWTGTAVIKHYNK